MRFCESWTQAGLSDAIISAKKKPAEMNRQAFKMDLFFRRYARAETRLVKRENFRATVFLWRTPVATPRAISG